MTERLQKITFGDMRDSGVHGVVVYCSDYRCAPRAATLAATLLGLRQRLGLGFGLGYCGRPGPASRVALPWSLPVRAASVSMRS